MLCIATNTTVAQNTQLRPYTIEDGLPQSQVYDMVQDDIGYLWLGTQGGGLANFDGNRFNVWNESNGLLSNYIHSLHSSNDTLFIGSKRGLSIKVKNAFLNFEAPQINQFYALGNTYYAATKQGIYRFSKEKGLQKILTHPEIDTSAINSILFDGSFFWVATNNGLWKLSELGSSAIEKTKLETNNFKSVVFHDHKIFAATFNDGILVLDTKGQDKTLLIREPLRINSMSINNKGELWVATDNDGITIIDTENYAEIKRLDTSDGLSVPHIRKIIDDKQSNIWIATSGGGFYKYFQNNFNHYDKDSGLKGNRTYAVHMAKDGVWISSSEAGLTKIDSLGIHYIPQANAFTNVKVKTIVSDKKGNIWAGSDGMGILFRETKKVDSIVTVATDSIHVQIDTLSRIVVKNHVLNSDNGFPSDWICKIVVDDQFIWAATYSSGIVKFNYYSKNDSLVIRKTFGKKEGIADLLLKDITIDGQGRLWYATQNGDLGYIKNNSITNLASVLNQQTVIRTVLFHQNYLFIGTSSQGVWYSEVNETLNFQKLKGAKNLSSENIYQLIFDNQGYLWVGTERGVDKIEINQANGIVDLYHFGKNDGFLGIETCLNAVDKDTEGNLWFGGIYGLTQYTPGENKIKTQRPKIRFKEVEIDYQIMDSIEPNNWAKANKVLRLNPRQTQLAFSFNTVDLDHPNEIQYRSKLNETEWGPWSSENRQNLVGLAYGSHVFSVQSRNYRWEESDPIQFGFHIDSPLHRKLWFQWTLLGLTALFLTGISLLYIRRIKQRNKEEQQQLQLQNHLLSLEQKALRLQMNPHFIFNVLNGIKAMGSHKPQKMNATINSFALLLRETLYNSRKDHISLDQEIKTLHHYIEVEQLMAPKSFIYDIIVETEPAAEEILIPPMLLQPFVENAIRHGILKWPREGELSIRFYTAEDFLHCMVTDNGPGIFQSQKVKTQTDHQSMALTVTRERLESIAGKDALKITEIKNDDQTVAGTRIALKIPLQTDY